MTSDKEIENNLKLLDSILKCLIQDTPNYITTLETLYEKVFGHPLAKDGKSGHINFVIIHGKDFNFNDFNSMSDNLKAEYLKFNFACNYLFSENLVSIDDKNQIVITYKGIIQYSKSFLTEHKQNESKRLFDKYISIITLGISLITFLIGLKLEDIILKYFH